MQVRAGRCSEGLKRPKVWGAGKGGGAGNVKWAHGSGGGRVEHHGQCWSRAQKKPKSIGGKLERSGWTRKREKGERTEGQGEKKKRERPRKAQSFFLFGIPA